MFDYFKPICSQTRFLCFPGVLTGSKQMAERKRSSKGSEEAESARTTRKESADETKAPTEGATSRRALALEVTNQVSRFTRPPHVFWWTVQFWLNSFAVFVTP